MNVVIGEEVTIDPDEAALVTDRVELVTDKSNQTSSSIMMST